MFSFMVPLQMMQARSLPKADFFESKAEKWDITQYEGLIIKKEDKRRK